MFFGLFKRKKGNDNKKSDKYEEKLEQLEKLNSSILGKAEEEIRELSRHEKKVIKKEDQRKKLITDTCTKIVQANKAAKQAINDFGEINTQIEDVVKLLDGNEKVRNSIQKNVEKIKNLNIEKEKYVKTNDELVIDTAHYVILEKNENNMVNEIKKLEEYEKEYLTIRSDLHKLEGERGDINYERKRLLSRKNLLKYYVRLLIVVSIILLLIFGVVGYYGILTSYIPVMISISLIAINTVFVVNSIRKNAYKLEANRIKENKLILLFNKVKIKYVNSVKLVEYIHNKYKVNNCKQLKALWEIYLKEKERKYKYEKNLELIKVYEDSLEVEFKKMELKNATIWKRKTDILSSEDELLAFKEELYKKKEEVRDKIEENKKTVAMGMQEINNIIKENSEYKKEILNVMNQLNFQNS